VHESKLSKASSLKRVIASKFLKASSQKWVLESEFSKVSSQKQVLESEFLKVSSWKRVIKSEFMKASLWKWVHESKFLKQVLESKFSSEFSKATRFKWTIKIIFYRWCQGGHYNRRPFGPSLLAQSHQNDSQQATTNGRYHHSSLSSQAIPRRPQYGAQEWKVHKSHVDSIINVIFLKLEFLF
jgi:hypothetical protein